MVKKKEAMDFAVAVTVASPAFTIFIHNAYTHARTHTLAMTTKSSSVYNI